MREINHFINGAQAAGGSDRFGEVYNPNTGEVQARVSFATAREVDDAVQAAKAVLPGWAATNPQRRARVLLSSGQITFRTMSILIFIFNRAYLKALSLWLKNLEGKM